MDLHGNLVRLIGEECGKFKTQANKELTEFYINITNPVFNQLVTLKVWEDAVKAYIYSEKLSGQATNLPSTFIIGSQDPESNQFVTISRINSDDLHEEIRQKGDYKYNKEDFIY